VHDSSQFHNCSSDGCGSCGAGHSNAMVGNGGQWWGLPKSRSRRRKTQHERRAWYGRYAMHGPHRVREKRASIPRALARAGWKPSIARSEYGARGTVDASRRERNLTSLRLNTRATARLTTLERLVAAKSLRKRRGPLLQAYGYTDTHRSSRRSHGKARCLPAANGKSTHPYVHTIVGRAAIGSARRHTAQGAEGRDQ
jgi:hypothetical protein